MKERRIGLSGARAAFVILVTIIFVNMTGTAVSYGQGTNFEDLTVTAASEVGYVPPDNCPGIAGIGDILDVKVDKPGALSGRASFPNSTSIVLYLDNRPLKGVYAENIDDSAGTLQFMLSREPGNQDNINEWTRLLGDPPLKQNFLERPTAVTIGLRGMSPRPSKVTSGKFSIKRMSAVRLWCCVAIYIVLLFLFWYAAKYTDMLRDTGPEPLDGKSRKPYSLARMQMALWTLVIIWSSLFIWLIVGDNDLVTLNVLGYMGISVGTAGWALTIDKGNEKSFNERLASLRSMSSNLDDPDDNIRKEIDELTVSQGLLKDLFTDINGGSLHRYQLAAWTLVLMYVFLSNVWTGLAMPEFSATTLALMGFSNGTYIWFKNRPA